MHTTVPYKTLLACLSTLLLVACDKTYSINRSIQFEGSLAVACVESSATSIGLEAELNNDIYNRPVEEYFSVDIRRGGTPSINASWIIDEPQSLNLSYSTIGSSDRATEQAVCDLMSEYIDSFAMQCASGADSVVLEDDFNNTSCIVTR